MRQETLFYLCLTGVCFATLRWQHLFLPLCFCLFFALCLKEPAKKLSRFLHLPLPLCAFLTTGLCFLVLAGGLFLIVYSLCRLVPGLIEWGIAFLETPAVTDFLRNLQNGLPGTLSEHLASFLSSAALSAGQWLSGFGTFLFQSMLCCLGTFLFIINYDSGVKGLFRLLPEGIKRQFLFLKQAFLRGVFATLRMHLIVYVVLFLSISLTLYAFGISGAFSLGLLIGFFDLLPFVGVGGILAPWGVYSLLSGRPFFGVALLILCAALSVAKGIMEPKLLGTAMRLNPIITFSSVFVGLGAFGFMGAVLLPIYCSVAVELFKGSRADPIDAKRSQTYNRSSS